MAGKKRSSSDDNPTTTDCRLIDYATLLTDVRIPEKFINSRLKYIKYALEFKLLHVTIIYYTVYFRLFAWSTIIDAMIIPIMTSANPSRKREKRNATKIKRFHRITSLDFRSCLFLLMVGHDVDCSRQNVIPPF